MNKKIYSIIAVSVMALSACSIGSSTESQLSETLTKMNDSEAQYRSSQSTLTELEQTEQKTFTETMELTKEDVDQLRNKVAELEKSIEDRLAQLKEEEAAMHEAKGFVTELESIAEKASEAEKKKIEELNRAVQDRYDLHDQFIEAYRALSSQQKEFYALLVKENVELADLKEKVKEVNEQNEVVKDAIAKFNEATKIVNDLKQDVFSSLEKEE
ncbi:YkyA family protein [Sporosarcina saromensis]|uniref:YkyA family protein n=1 Tax=Sporosarcina saromensis TaxID=359365 RepID=A0ABU4G4P5_9BACL|nr:YkyA family protein [Sporosarcina saromensis]MDW0111924.1 YkyA family protein [Sporosarcina saromensis]